MRIDQKHAALIGFLLLLSGCAQKAEAPPEAIVTMPPAVSEKPASADETSVESVVVTGAATTALGDVGRSARGPALKREERIESAVAAPAPVEALAAPRASLPPPSRPAPPPPPPPPPPPRALAPRETAPLAAEGSIRPQATQQAREVIDRRQPERDPPRFPHPQAGQLTAGDHDDLLNPGLYEAYARRYRERFNGSKMPLIDTAGRVVVKVTGRGGRPLANAEVTARKPDGGEVTLHTAASGEAVLFSEYDRLGASIQLTVRQGGAVESRRVNLAGLPKDRTVRIAMAAPADAPPAVDLVLVMDTTGSMGDELNYLTAEMAEILGALGQRHPGADIRTGLVFYRDTGDEYLLRTYPFMSDRGLVQNSIAHQQAGGGGDYPEAVHRALAEALTYPWRDDAVKIMLLVGDAPPHEQFIEAAWDAADQARGRQIHIVPVAASGADDQTQYLMRAMAALTQSRYLFITDDSRIGNAHAEPSVDCYLVTRLNTLIGRVLDGLIAGQRVEPDPSTVIRSVGNYDRGVCRPRQGAVGG